MRHILLILVCAWIATPALAAPQSADAEARLVGTWAGTYEGGASGKYTMSFAREGSGPITGTLDLTPDYDAPYTVTFKSIVVAGDSVRLAYDAPEAAGVEVQLEGALDGTSFKGSWKAVEAGATTMSGTFGGSKK